MHFFVNEEHFGIHSLKPFHKSHVRKYEVETINLNEIPEKHKIDCVTLLKVDTEGAGFLALKGFDVNRYKPGLVMIEFMDERSSTNFGYTHHDVVKFMSESRYAAFVSEWAPIKEYGREGQVGVTHKCLQSVPYPSDHTQSWGNLIFVSAADEIKFTKTLNWYFVYLRIGTLLEFSKNLIKLVPGATNLYRLIKRN